MEYDDKPSEGRPPDGGDQETEPDGPSLGPEGIYRFGWSFYLWLAIVAVVWIGVREDGFRPDLFVTIVAGDAQGPQEIPWPTASLGSSLALDLGLGVASGLFILLGWTLLERRVRSAAELGRRLAEMLRGLTLGEALVLALLSSFAEELFFRGAVQGSWPGIAGFLFATVLFAVVHSGPGREFRWWSLFALIAGGVMGAWVLLRGNLTAAILTHWTVNTIQLARIASSPDTAPADSEPR